MLRHLWRLFGVGDRTWTAPTGLETATAQNRLAEVTQDSSWRWTPIRVRVDRKGRLYYLAASPDPIADLRTFSERFEVAPRDRTVEVVSRPHPFVRWMVPLAVVLLVGWAVVSLVAAVAGDGHRAVDAAVAALAAAGLIVAVQLGRRGHRTQMRRWLTSILAEDDTW